MKLKKATIAFAILTACSVATAQELFVRKGFFGSAESTVVYGQKITTKNTIGEYPLLPIGVELTAINSRAYSASNVPIPMGRLTTYAAKGKIFNVGLDVVANLGSMSAGDWTDEPCKRENYIWQRSTGRQFADINCVTINHRTNFFVNPTGDFQQLLAKMKAEGLEFPPTTVTVTFTRYSTQGRRLVYTVEINPELYGVQRDATAVWGANSWHKEFIARDAKKVEFIENLKKWATDAQDRMNAAFSKEDKAFDGLKPLDEYLTGIKTEAFVRPSQSSSTEDRLVNLKSLYQKGLLTESQYNEQVKTILSDK